VRERQEIQEVSRPGRVVPRHLGPLASGLLLWAAFPPLDLGLLAWVALVPLLWSLRTAAPREAFWQGYLTGLVWLALTLSWITLFGVVTWALLAAFLALYIGGFAGLLRWVSPRYPGWDLLLIPLVWTAVEVARSIGPLAFPWGLLGVSQHRTLPVLQLAAIGGVHFVSFTIALGNASLVTLVARPRRAEVVGLVLVALVLAGGVAYGARRLQMPLGGPLRLAALQPNISPFAKGDVSTHQTQLAVMERLTREARARGADVIVFPETAIPVNLFGPGGTLPEIAAWAPDRIVVASSFEASGAAVRNTAVVLQDGEVRGTYAKRRLVPFGEAGVTPGRTRDPVPTRAGSVGIAICYESAFAEIAREETRPDAGPFVVLTNDGWFGTSAGPAQHAAYTPLRAVETGRPVARAANTGISMIVDPLGRVLTRLPLGQEGVIVARVPAAVPTPYLRGGWLVGPGMLIVLVLLILPAAAGSARSWWQEPPFRRLVASLVWPGLLLLLQPSVGGLMPTAGRWIVPVAVLFAVWITAGGWKGLAFWPRRTPVSALLGLGVVGALGAVMLSAYAHYGFFLQMTPLPGGWLVGGAALLLGALAWEGWLRGAVFTFAQAWRGPWIALLLSTLPPLVVSAGGPPEVLIWSLLVGAVFGVIRLLTGDALGLAVPRAVGLILLGMLTVLR